MSTLSLNDIANLLGDDSLKPKPKQAGPMRYNRVFGNCVRCGVACAITVQDAYFCTTHAVYALNKLLIQPSNILIDCTCEAGSNTMFSLHTPDCTVYERLPE